MEHDLGTIGLVNSLEKEFLHSNSMSKKDFSNFVKKHLCAAHDFKLDTQILLILRIYLELKKGLVNIVSISTAKESDLSKFSLSKSHIVEIETRLLLIQSQIVKILSTSSTQDRKYLIATTLTCLDTYTPEISHAYASLLLLSRREGSESWESWVPALKEQQKLLNKLVLELGKDAKMHSEKNQLIAENMELLIQ